MSREHGRLRSCYSVSSLGWIFLNPRVDLPLPGCIAVAVRRSLLFLSTGDRGIGRGVITVGRKTLWDIDLQARDQQEKCLEHVNRGLRGLSLRRGTGARSANA